ncbi:hypothetical protein ACE41H_24720 [Paenibacillus enshidis]|uniref:DUF1640 domain-containing protein n=1 Tax=Paenibacillus enshidis TaxID=1458439 RepID=A0ABV5B103_9BACL
MNVELKELLQSVIREELKPVHERIDKMETEMSESFDKMETDRQEIKQEIREIRVDQLEMKRAVLDTNERVMAIGGVHQRMFLSSYQIS